MELCNELWLVEVTKRDGTKFTGTMRDDGLQSLYAVNTPTGPKYCTVLDTIKRLKRLNA